MPQTQAVGAKALFQWLVCTRIADNEAVFAKSETWRPDTGENQTVTSQGCMYGMPARKSQSKKMSLPVLEKKTGSCPPMRSDL